MSILDCCREKKVVLFDILTFEKRSKVIYFNHVDIVCFNYNGTLLF